MNTIMTTILVALLRTAGEGGGVDIVYPTPEACEAAGIELEAKFKSITLINDSHPSVKWVCIDGPSE